VAVTWICAVIGGSDMKPCCDWWLCDMEPCCDWWLWRGRGAVLWLVAVTWTWSCAVIGWWQSSVASYIRLFEPLVIKSLKQYTVTSQIRLQQQVLDLLAQLVQLRVNYCLLDSDQVFAINDNCANCRSC